MLQEVGWGERHMGSLGSLTLEDLTCPICMESLKDPFVTPCGHSFCYSCIIIHLQNKKVCPSCSQYLTPDKVFPNYLLSKVSCYSQVKVLTACGVASMLKLQGLPDIFGALHLAVKSCNLMHWHFTGRLSRGGQVVARVAREAHSKEGTLVEQLQAAISSDKQGLRLPDVDILLETLEEKKHHMQQREKENNLELLLHFLNHSKCVLFFRNLALLSWLWQHYILLALGQTI